MKKYLLIILLLLGFFLRTYRLGDLLGFYFDQGRDGKVIWDLLHHGKFFLIGPTTGIEGIFLGPFYYYLMAPAYLLGGGNPVWPAYELALINVLAIGVFYLITIRHFSPGTGIVTVILMALSNRLVQDQRWLSNPTPLPLFSGLALWSLLEIISGKTKWWWLLGLSIGLSLQLEAASATFFLPATILVLVIFLKSVSWKWPQIMHGLFMFCLTLLPQLYFNFRHENILFKAFQRFLISEKSFQATVSGFYSDRLHFYFRVFTEKLINSSQLLPILLLLLGILFLIVFRKFFTKSTTVLLVWIFVPLISLLFYHGNNGYVWGYYFTGVYPAFIVLIAFLMALGLRRKGIAAAVAVIILSLFIYDNLTAAKNYLSSGIDGPITITLGNSLKAVDQVYEDAGDTPFNVDVYVPPVISHAYDYLFIWRGSTRYFTQPETNLKPRLYTVFEQDPPHPERLAKWLARQATYAGVDSTATFGGVTVQKRTRYGQN
jgi:4-amino-4-deoxy-L-arabinose transferase-like glycosyltransferase